LTQLEVRVRATAQFRFDAASEQRLAKLYQILRKLRVNVREQPHITLFTCENLPLKPVCKRLKRISQRFSRFEVKFYSAGIFFGTAGLEGVRRSVLFLQPICTETLLEIHKQATCLLDKGSKADLSPHHARDQWVPHVTVATDLSNAKLVHLLDVVQGSISLPITATVDRIEFLSRQHKEEFYFKGS